MAHLKKGYQAVRYALLWKIGLTSRRCWGTQRAEWAIFWAGVRCDKGRRRRSSWRGCRWRTAMEWCRFESPSPCRTTMAGAPQPRWAPAWSRSRQRAVPAGRSSRPKTSPTILAWSGWGCRLRLPSLLLQQLSGNGGNYFLRTFVFINGTSRAVFHLFWINLTKTNLYQKGRTRAHVDQVLCTYVDHRREPWEPLFVCFRCFTFVTLKVLSRKILRTFLQDIFSCRPAWCKQLIGNYKLYAINFLLF